MKKLTVLMLLALVSTSSFAQRFEHDRRDDRRDERRDDGRNFGPGPDRRDDRRDHRRDGRFDCTRSIRTNETFCVGETVVRAFGGFDRGRITRTFDRGLVEVAFERSGFQNVNVEQLRKEPMRPTPPAPEYNVVRDQRGEMLRVGSYVQYAYNYCQGVVVGVEPRFQTIDVNWTIAGCGYARGLRATDVYKIERR